MAQRQTECSTCGVPFPTDAAASKHSRERLDNKGRCPPRVPPVPGPVAPIPSFPSSSSASNFGKRPTQGGKLYASVHGPVVPRPEPTRSKRPAPMELDSEDEEKDNLDEDPNVSSSTSLQMAVEPKSKKRTNSKPPKKTKPKLPHVCDDKCVHCPHCPKRYADRSGFTKHHKNHHGGVPQKCADENNGICHPNQLKASQSRYPCPSLVLGECLYWLVQVVRAAEWIPFSFIYDPHSSKPCPYPDIIDGGCGGGAGRVEGTRRERR